MVCALSPTGIVMARPSVYPTGVTIYKPDKAYNSYVVYSAPDGKSRMIDMDGNEVNTWPYVGFPTDYIDPNIIGGKAGHVLVHLDSFFNDKTVAEVDWNSKIVWQWGRNAPGGAVMQNHDWGRLANGNTLMLCTFRHVIPKLSSKPIDDQAIYEVSPEGEIVWKWVASDHLMEFGISHEGMRVLQRVMSNGFSGWGYLTINDMKTLGPNKWWRAGDTRFNPDNIIIDSREASFIAVINKKTGSIVWRLGPNYPTVWKKTSSPDSELSIEPVFTDNVPRPLDQTSGQHDANMIAEGLPGAGNILLFDNEGPSGFPSIRQNHHVGSRILEINPITKQIVWQYTADNSNQPDWDFFSAFISSARRLPNGNTLIDEGMYGRFFQVTLSGEIVWEYVNPHSGPAYAVLNINAQSNWVYRAQPVPYDWAPVGTPHSEVAVVPPVLSNFHIPLTK
jgi:hypothetical protein